MHGAAPDLFNRIAAPRPPDIPAEVCDLFEKFALQIIAAGHARYSSDAILHRIRWHEQIERRRSDFKCNNNWTAPLARWFIAKHPAHANFFATRKSPHHD